MEEQDITKEELISELAKLRRRVAKLEALEIQRKLAEEALRRSEEELQTVFDSARDGIVVLDTKGKVVRINKYILEVGGYPEEALVGRHIEGLEMFPPESLARILSAFRRLEAGEMVPPYEVTAHLQTGEKKFIEIHSSLLKRNGRVVGIVALLRDITERKEAFERVRKTMEGTVEALMSATERRDPYTAGHQQRVTKLACAIARELGVSQDEAEGIRVAGSLHDIGKIYVPAEILSKPGRISTIEFSLIKIHPEVGQEILRAIDFPWPVADIVLQHHERWNGSGYPAGLEGEHILPEARILAVADVMEAMSSHRPYRPSCGVDRALEEISRNRGILYDPTVVDACVELFIQKGFRFDWA